MRLIIFFMAIALAAGAFVFTAQLTAKPKESPLPVATPQVVVKDMPTVDIYTAKADIPIGTIINKELLDIQPFPKNLLLDDMVQADPNTASNIVKMIARTPFQKGEPLFLSKLGNEKDPSFLAAALPRGMRMVTIAVDTVSGVGSFLYPGDRVDVLITHDVALGRTRNGADAGSIAPVAANNEPVKRDPVTEVLLSNIKVLAVNQKAVIHGPDGPGPLSNVSIEVSSVDAQKLRLTENGNGRLSLALRSIKDKEENELARPTGINDLSRLTPPAFFPVLYDNVNKVNTASATPAATSETPSTEAAAVPNKMIVNVVRGTKSEPVEVSQP